MKEVLLTTTSAKGQVVIPQKIRKELGIESGTVFAVYGKNGTIILRRLEMPTPKDFEKLAAFGRSFAKKKRIRERDVLQDD